MDGTLSVYGGAAGDGASVTSVATQPSDGLAGGNGGKAAIHVPSGTALTLGGCGKVMAYGGFAGNGGHGGKNANGETVQFGPGGGGGAGAGIGGDGGKGQNGSNANVMGIAPSGENAGEINIFDTLTVNAYGGGGGWGGHSSGNDGGNGGGGGGYPAAGIGGGGGAGGGGNHGQGGGGFSGGCGEGGKSSGVNANGTAGLPGGVGAGGGYFADAANTTNGSYAITNGGYPGRIGGLTHKIGTFTGNFYSGGKAGDGGKGGSGGDVRLSVKASEKLVAQNGTWNTDATAWTADPTPIYLQLGYNLDSIRSADITEITDKTEAGVRTAMTNKVASVNASPKQGVGSGAGSTETSIICNLPRCT